MAVSIAAEERKWVMGLLARADPAALSELWTAWPNKPAFTWLRQPESGLVMVRGRTGGEGAAFNLGEMTLTRCALRLEDGIVGHAYVEGRSAEKAEVAALVDALHQRPGDQEAVRRRILEPLEQSLAAAKAAAAAETAATRVEFFTLVRGEDE